MIYDFVAPRRRGRCYAGARRRAKNGAHLDPSVIAITIVIALTTALTTVPSITLDKFRRSLRRSALTTAPSIAPRRLDNPPRPARTPQVSKTPFGDIRIAETRYRAPGTRERIFRYSQNKNPPRSLPAGFGIELDPATRRREDPDRNAVTGTTARAGARARSAP
jgi:hypothetical protein